MTLTLPDPTSTLASILSDNWDSSNTGGVTPDFKHKAKMVIEDQTVQILYYLLDTVTDDLNRGTFFDQEDICSIELRVEASDNTNFQLIAKEILRIFGLEAVRLQTTDYDYINYKGMKDESYAGNNWWRKIFDIRLYRYNVSKT